MKKALIIHWIGNLANVHPQKHCNSEALFLSNMRMWFTEINLWRRPSRNGKHIAVHR